MGEDTPNGQNGQSAAPATMTAFPMDTAGLADIRTDEEVEMTPQDLHQAPYKRRKGLKKYKSNAKGLVPIRPKPK